MLSCQQLLLTTESLLSYFAGMVEQPLWYHGIALSPEDVGSTRGLLPSIYRMMSHHAELCRLVLPPEEHGFLFGWTAKFQLLPDSKTLTGERLSCDGKNSQFNGCHYILFASLYHATMTTIANCQTDMGIIFDKSIRDIYNGNDMQPE